MDEYLDSKAMLTPGVAGAMVTLVTANLVDMFPIKGNWVALLISFLIGVLVLQDKAVPMLQRSVLYVLNSLIIFSVACGINVAGYSIIRSQHLAEQAGIEQPVDRQGQASPRGIEDETTFFRAWNW